MDTADEVSETAAELASPTPCTGTGGAGELSGWWICRMIERGVGSRVSRSESSSSANSDAGHDSGAASATGVTSGAGR